MRYLSSLHWGPTPRPPEPSVLRTLCVSHLAAQKCLCLLLLLPAFTLARPVDVSDATAAKAWHAAQVGQPAIVRVPLVRVSKTRWALGAKPAEPLVETGVELTFSPIAQDLPAKLATRKAVVLAEGRYGPKGTTFNVLRWRFLRRGEAPRAQVVLAGKRALEVVAPLKDDRPWLAIAHTLDLNSKSCTQGADLRRKRLIEKGFVDAEVIDSRQAPRLACCSKTVLLGRFSTRAAAAVLVRKAQKQKIRGYVRRGW